ncbi:MAG TPA: NAD-dependent deacylase [Bryobacteraceae bacterium]
MQHVSACLAYLQLCLEQARSWISKASSIAVVTGAGISAESGIPTFRGAGGLWKQFRPEDLATPEAFARDPKTVWEWYDWRRGLVHNAKPNPGHIALTELERRVPRLTLVTQNVDGLHGAAGSRHVLEIHGSIWKLRCVECGRRWEDRSVPLQLLPPRCECGGLARPDIVWFGEALPQDLWQTAERAAMASGVFLSVGTSAVVYPAAGLVELARSGGAKIIEINLESTAISKSVDCALAGPAGEILPKLLADLGQVAGL